jgi:predicted transposase YbfD/YdcC
MAGLSFFQHFYNLRDPRRQASTTYRLLDLVFITVCATIAGADDWPAVATFAEERRDWLDKFCRLPPGEAPCADTFERLFKRLNPRAFARCFANWAAALAEGLSLKQVAIDGKALRGSAQPGKGLAALHLVSAWATENHLSLAQVAVDKKSNEITAVPALLGLLELSGALVTLDAMHCQKGTARQIVEAGADYILVVKANQGRLYEDIAAAFKAAAEKDFEGVRHDYHQTEERGHGRRERREYITLHELGLIRDRDRWAKLAVVGLCIHQREVGGQRSIEEHYFIGSRDMSAAGYGAGLRGHWGIENNLHWQLDVAFGEDANRVGDRNAAQNLAVVRRLAVSLIKRHKGKKSIAKKRYAATLNTKVLEEILEVG